MISTIRKLNTFIDAPTRLQLALLFIPMLAVSILEMASIGMILPFVQVLVSPDRQGPIMTFIEWLLPGIAPEKRLLWIAVIFSALFIAKNMALFAMIFVINNTIHRKLALFLQRLFFLYLNRPLLFHLRRNSAEIIRNLHTSGARAFESIRLLLMILLETMLVLVTFVLLLFLEPVFTLIAGGVLVGFGLLFHRIAGPYFQRWGESAQKFEGQMIKSINEALGSIRDIKLLHVQKAVGSEFAVHTNGLAKNFSHLNTSQYIPRLSVETLVILGFAAVIIGLVSSKESVEEVIAALGLFGMASLRLMPSLNRILTSMANLRNRLASIKVLYSDLSQGLDDSEESYSRATKEDLPFAREIEFAGVSFSYPGGDRAAVREIDLTIASGEFIAIVGPSGAGKSTLLDILLGFLAPDSGILNIDGREMATNTGAWQKHLGYVPQQVYLIDDTLKHNIAFGLEAAAIDPGQVEKAVAMANLGPVLETLPQGLDTLLDEGGARLSGGQRQRVAIARALYRDPEVLIFDEATSDLDSETEMEISAAIERLRGKKTVIIISHKLSIVRNCDKVVFMKDGKIAGIGHFDELIAGNPMFKKFAEAGEYPDPAQSHGISA